MPGINSPTPDSTPTAKGKVQLAGDLGGTAAAPSVLKLNGVSVTGTPISGQVPTATSATAATWQTPSGGGGGGSSPGLMTTHLSTPNSDASADQITYISAAIPTASFSVTTMKAIVTTNNYGSAATLELGIYSSASPKALLSSGTVSIPANTTGIYTVTLGSSVSLTAGTVYYLALLSRTSTGDQVRFAFISNMSNAMLSSFNSTTGNTTMQSTITAVNATGRNYWMMAY